MEMVLDWEKIVIVKNKKRMQNKSRIVHSGKKAATAFLQTLGASKKKKKARFQKMKIAFKSKITFTITTNKSSFQIGGIGK